MGGLRNIPIQRKLRVVILATCSAALVVACGALFALQFVFFKQDFERDLAALAKMISMHCRGPLSAKNQDAAREILNALGAKPQIARAAIVLEDGSIFAEIGDTSRSDPPKSALLLGIHEIAGETLYIAPIKLNKTLLGTLILHADYRTQANELLRVYAGILAAVLTISFLVAVLISWRLERLILYPIQSLAYTAWAISRRNDYSVRAEKYVEDELGSFTDSFNAMLDQIEARDRALRHEIAERKRAEEELQRMQHQLIETSRQAGMAEVATGVLHNVGNVLNSVNVSATLIAEKLHHSKVGNLTRAATLLCEQNGSLTKFLTDDPKGRILPGYIADVSALLAKEREAALVELGLLSKNIEHIKDIVARQQNYARVSDLLEAFSLGDLIEDAIRMNADSFDRHRVIVVRDFENVPDVLVDKHKVLQILINILRNAKQAITDSGPVDRRVYIQLRSVDGRCAQVQIRDTGVGIAAENLTKIFSHGFTTRKEGHGFGLHSAAVATQDMGGRLSAESDGPGKGATFILELPLAAPASADLLPTPSVV